MDSKEFKKELFSWTDGIESDKKIWADKIYDLVDAGTLSKLEAIRLIRRCELLSIDSSIELPKFVDQSFRGRDINRYQIIYYDDLFDDLSDFKKEGEPTDKYAYFPEITIEDAIDETYDFIKTNGIIGCIFDW